MFLLAYFGTDKAATVFEMNSTNSTNSTFKPLAGFFKYINELNRNYAQIPHEDKLKMTILQRVSAYNWSFELCVVGLVVLIFIISKFGSNVNVSRSDKFFDSIHTFLKNDLGFARVGFTLPNAGNKNYLDQHLHTWLTSFATGRSTIEGVDIKLHLLPRNNPLSMILENVVGWYFPILSLDTDTEYCEIEVKPNGVFVGSENANVNGNGTEILNYFKFITSIVNKSVMNQARHDNYYLSLTHTSESEELPMEFVNMSEMNQLKGFITSYFNKDNLTGLLEKSIDFLDFISFTDLPADKPENASIWNATKKPRCVIRTKVPTTQKELDLLNQIIALVVEVYDNYTRNLVQKNDTPFVTNDILKKTINFRTIELQKITKAAREIELEKEKEDKREADREKRRGLKKSGELDRIDQKMKEKRERRQKNKQKARM